MKVAVLSSHTPSLFWFRIDMMKAFVACGWEVVAIGQSPESAWREKFNGFGIVYRQIFIERNGMNPLKDIRMLNALIDLLKKEMPDKIFTYQAKTIIYGGLAAHKCKIDEVYSLIAGLGSVFRGKGVKNKILRMVLKYEYKIACRYSRAVFFQNIDDRNVFLDEKIVPMNKAVIINGSGVNLEKFVPTKLPDKTAFLFIGRLLKDKGVCEYLEACKAIKSEFPDIRCLLVGPFDSNPSAITPVELQMYIDSRIVEYFGEQEDVRRFIDQCSVYVLPSYHEGIPKTVLEAMASGRAIITTDAPGCRETVEDGVNGFLVPIRDLHSLITKMRYFIDTSEASQKMGERSRRMAEDRFDVHKINESILSTMGISSLM